MWALPRATLLSLDHLLRGDLAQANRLFKFGMKMTNELGLGSPVVLKAITGDPDLIYLMILMKGRDGDNGTHHVLLQNF